MVTKDILEAAPWHQIWHYSDDEHPCIACDGPKGGYHEKIVRIRMNGQLKTWKKDPKRFRQPIKHGLRGFGKRIVWRWQCTGHCTRGCLPRLYAL